MEIQITLITDKLVRPCRSIFSLVGHVFPSVSRESYYRTYFFISDYERFRIEDSCLEFASDDYWRRHPELKNERNFHIAIARHNLTLSSPYTTTLRRLNSIICAQKDKGKLCTVLCLIK